VTPRLPELATARPLADGLYGDLVWSRPGVFRRELRLESGSDVLAVLRWENLFSFEAVGESADGRWIFGRRHAASLLGTTVVREADTQAELATFTRHWRGTGTLRFASGAEFKFERSGFWRPVHFWSSSRQPRLVAFQTSYGFRRRYQMEVDPAARGVAELPVLVLLGGYLMVLLHRQGHAH
jgi:hypothetical protein